MTFTAAASGRNARTARPPSIACIPNTAKGSVHSARSRICASCGSRVGFKFYFRRASSSDRRHRSAIVVIIVIVIVIVIAVIFSAAEKTSSTNARGPRCKVESAKSNTPSKLHQPYMLTPSTARTSGKSGAKLTAQPSANTTILSPNHATTRSPFMRLNIPKVVRIVDGTVSKSASAASIVFLTQCNWCRTSPRLRASRLAARKWRSEPNIGKNIRQFAKIRNAHALLVLADKQPASYPFLQ